MIGKKCFEGRIVLFRWTSWKVEFLLLTMFKLWALYLPYPPHKHATCFINGTIQTYEAHDILCSSEFYEIKAFPRQGGILVKKRKILTYMPLYELWMCHQNASHRHINMLLDTKCSTWKDYKKWDYKPLNSLPLQAGLQGWVPHNGFLTIGIRAGPPHQRFKSTRLRYRLD